MDFAIVTMLLTFAVASARPSLQIRSYFAAGN
jgi:hypothetical protein